MQQALACADASAAEFKAAASPNLTGALLRGLRASGSTLPLRAWAPVLDFRQAVGVGEPAWAAAAFLPSLAQRAGTAPDVLAHAVAVASVRLIADLSGLRASATDVRAGQGRRLNLRRASRRGAGPQRPPSRSRPLSVAQEEVSLLAAPGSLLWLRLRGTPLSGDGLGQIRRRLVRDGGLRLLDLADTPLLAASDLASCLGCGLRWVGMCPHPAIEDAASRVALLGACSEAPAALPGTVFVPASLAAAVDALACRGAGGPHSGSVAPSAVRPDDAAATADGDDEAASPPRSPARAATSSELRGRIEAITGDVPAPRASRAALERLLRIAERVAGAAAALATVATGDGVAAGRAAAEHLSSLAERLGSGWREGAAPGAGAAEAAEAAAAWAVGALPGFEPAEVVAAAAAFARAAEGVNGRPGSEVVAAAVRRLLDGADVRLAALLRGFVACVRSQARPEPEEAETAGEAEEAARRVAAAVLAARAARRAAAGSSPGAAESAAARAVRAVTATLTVPPGAARARAVAEAATPPRATAAAAEAGSPAPGRGEPLSSAVAALGGGADAAAAVDGHGHESPSSQGDATAAVVPPPPPPSPAAIPPSSSSPSSVVAGDRQGPGRVAAALLPASPGRGGGTPAAQAGRAASLRPGKRPADQGGPTVTPAARRPRLADRSGTARTVPARAAAPSSASVTASSRRGRLLAGAGIAPGSARGGARSGWTPARRDSIGSARRSLVAELDQAGPAGSTPAGSARRRDVVAAAAARAASARPPSLPGARSGAVPTHGAPRAGAPSRFFRGAGAATARQGARGPGPSAALVLARAPPGSAVGRRLRRCLAAVTSPAKAGLLQDELMAALEAAAAAAAGGAGSAAPGPKAPPTAPEAASAGFLEVLAMRWAVARAGLEAAEEAAGDAGRSSGHERELYAALHASYGRFKAQLARAGAMDDVRAWLDGDGPLPQLGRA